MDIHNICDTVMRLYLYLPVLKRIHYTIDSSHGHRLCDEIYEAVLKFADDLAEKSFGWIGKPSYTDFKDIDGYSVNDDESLSKVCESIKDLVEPIRKEAEKDDKGSGIVSLIDDFKGEIDKMVFLTTFDHLK